MGTGSIGAFLCIKRLRRLDIEQTSVADYITAIFDAAVEALLWSELDDFGEPLGVHYTAGDLGTKVTEQLADELDGFFETNWQVLYNLDPARVGLDFVLTRNGHGAGFWDGHYAMPVGDQLTASAKPYGTLGLYADEFGTLHGHN